MGIERAECQCLSHGDVSIHCIFNDLLTSCNNNVNNSNYNVNCNSDNNK